MKSVLFYHIISLIFHLSSDVKTGFLCNSIDIQYTAPLQCTEPYTLHVYGFNRAFIDFYSIKIMCFKAVAPKSSKNIALQLPPD